eukprot:UN1415
MLENERLGRMEATERLALAVVESRAFSIGGQPVLCPLLDLLNHWVGPDTDDSPRTPPCRFESRGEDVVMVATRNIEANEELLHAYRNHSSLQLLMQYGFVPGHNVFELVELVLLPPVADDDLCAVLLRRGWDDPAEPLRVSLPADGMTGDAHHGHDGPLLRRLLLPRPHEPPGTQARVQEYLLSWIALVLDCFEDAITEVEALFNDYGGRAPPRLGEYILRLLESERYVVARELSAMVAASKVLAVAALRVRCFTGMAVRFGCHFGEPSISRTISASVLSLPTQRGSLTCADWASARFRALMHDG